MSEIGRDGNEKVQTYYDYTVENRLEAVYEGKKLLMAAAYDGDGNRVFQLNYNPTAYDDWKYTYGREGKRWEDWYDDCWAYWEDCDDERIEYDDDDNRNGSNNKETGNRGNNGRGNSLNGGCDGATKSALNRVFRSEKNDGNHHDTDNNTGTQNDTDQSRYCMYFPSDKDDEKDERGDKKWLNKAWYHCRNNDYELIEYINDVNREYVEVLVEQNVFGKTDTSYVYGVDRLSADTYCGRNSYYLYDGRGSVTGLTNEKGWLYQSYKYSVTGEITFGAPQYDNEYTYNGESYNPNIESQYLRARYYNVVTATFLTEDSYLGEITNPLTLNRYNYTLSNYLNYQDPSGHDAVGDAVKILANVTSKIINNSKPTVTIKDILPQAGVAEIINPNLINIYTHINQLAKIGSKDEIDKYIDNLNYSEPYIKEVERYAGLKESRDDCEILIVSLEQLKEFGWRDFGEDEEQYIVHFNSILNKYGITDNASITMFMATIAHESNFGMDTIEGMVDGKETLTEENWDAYKQKVGMSASIPFAARGAGYIQLTGTSIQNKFIEYIGAEEKWKDSGQDRVHFIAENYALEAAAWYWASEYVKSTGVGSLNEYALTYGNTHGIYLITQYFVNGYKDGIDTYLGMIRTGTQYEIKDEKLIVDGKNFNLPNNWSDREVKYETAYEIFK